MNIQLVPAPASLTFRSITDYAAAVGEAFASGEELALDLSSVEAPDLSVIQLVVAARKQAAETGISLSLATPATGPLTALLERAGFLAELSAADIDFWFHGDLPQ